MGQGAPIQGTSLSPRSPRRSRVPRRPHECPLPSPELLSHLQHSVARHHEHLRHVVRQHLAGVADVHSRFWGWESRG